MKKILICFLCLCLVTACSDTKKYAPKEGRQAVFERNIPSRSSGETALEQSVITQDWRHPLYNAQNRIPNLSCDFPDRFLWREKLGQKVDLKNRALATPLVVENKLYVLDGTYSLTQADMSNGKTIWRKQLENGKVGLSLDTNGQLLFALSQDGVLTAVDLEGNQVWQKMFDVETRAPLLVDGKALYLLTAYNQFVALNAKDGKEIWRYQTTRPQTWLTSMAAPAKEGNVVVVPFATGEVIAFEADSGLLLWIQMLIGNRPQDLIEIPQITAAPVIDKGVVYLTGNANLSGAYDLHTGEKRWSTLFSSRLAPVVNGNAFFMITKQDVLTALDKKTGKIFWQKEMHRDAKRQWQSLLLINDELILSDGEKLQFINPKTGEILRVREENLYGYPIVVDKHLITIEENTKVTCY